MQYKTFTLYDLSGTYAPLVLNPTWGFKENRLISKTEGATIGGRLNTYTAGANGYEWVLPLEFVNSAFRAQVNIWWGLQQELVFSVNSYSDFPSSCIVRIANQMEPLGQVIQPRDDLFRGGLILRETRQTGLVKATGFILDDPVLGLLDQTYNKLL